MTYYTLPRLFKRNNDNIINKILVTSQNASTIKNESLLEKFLNTLITDANRQKYEEIKTLYSFTDLLNMKLSDEIHHPKSYFAFIEISKVCNLFNMDHLNTLHLSETYDYLDALYQLRKNKDNYIYLTENYCVNLPEYISQETVDDISSTNLFCLKYKFQMDLICINTDDMNKIVRYMLTALLVQKRGGKMVIKIKRLNSYISKEIIYLLMSMYENVMIIKPKIVNSVNEYKYVVASNLSVDTNLHYNHFVSTIKKIYDFEYNHVITNLLDIELPQILINKVDECELIMSENTLLTHMKILNSIQVNNINVKSLEKKTESETNNWLKENDDACGNFVI